MTTLTTARTPLRDRLLGSARTRILLSFLILLAVSTLVSTLALRQILLARVGERLESALVQEIEEFRALTRDGRNPETGEPFGADIQAVFDVYLRRNVPSAGENLFTFVGTTPYQTTARLNGPLARQIAALGPIRRTVRGELDATQGRNRFIAVPVVVGGANRGAFAVTENLEQEQDEVDQAVQVAAGVSLAVLAVASLIAFLIAGRVLAPLRDITDTARSITESDLSRRIDAAGTDEVAETARTFNAMLDRLQDAFASQRAFLSDAGHELRTPITIIRGHLELLGDDPAERAESLAVVQDELDRMTRMVEDLLTLAKAERREEFLQPVLIDLDLFTEELMGKAERLGPRAWTLESVGAGRIVADRQRLTQAVMNLAGNAVQHTREGAEIALGSALEHGCARFWVRDSGPGVPEAERERIFERFARAGLHRRKTEGAGLGLAIVSAIATAHGGTVELSPPDPRRRGATFTITIPTDPPEESDAP